MVIKSLVGILVASCALSLAGCNSTSDSPSVKYFSSSTCKKERVSNDTRLAHLRSLRVIASERGLEGLRCVAWERVSADEVRLDLYNFASACGATWTGDGALAADGTLEVRIDNPSCTIALCGKCLYDWSFDLGVPLPAGASVPITIAVDTCPGQQAATVIPATLGPESSGIRCTLADYGAINQQAATLGTCGQAGMPCIGSLLCGSGSFTSTGTCAEGLVCDSSAATNEPVCLVPCASDIDCPRADVWSCQTGLCRPKG